MPLITTQHPNPVEAQYADGFVLNEAEQKDISIYDPLKNTMHDIGNKLPEKEHGPMVRFSIFVNGWLHLDWTKLPPNAKPIRYKQLEIDHNFGTGKTSVQRVVKIHFGFEYYDPKLGKKVQEIREIT